MKIKLDENLPDDLAPLLRALGHDVETVPSERISGADDDLVWSTAQREARFLITQDLDFSDIRRFLPGTHAGLLLVRLRIASRSALMRRVEAIFLNHDPEQWVRCFVVATERKVRVRKP